MFKMVKKMRNSGLEIVAGLTRPLNTREELKYYTSHQLLCSSIWLPWHIKLYRNRTGDSMDHLTFLNSIPPTL